MSKEKNQSNIIVNNKNIDKIIRSIRKSIRDSMKNYIPYSRIYFIIIDKKAKSKT